MHVGPVILETSDGVFITRGIYTKHVLLRPYQIAYEGQWYVQNRRQEDGWVYRALSSAPGTMVTDPALIVGVDALPPEAA